MAKKHRKKHEDDEPPAQESAGEEADGNAEEAVFSPYVDGGGVSEEAPEQSVGEEQTEPATVPAEEHAALTAERDELKDRLLRLRAEFENFRKRMMRQAEELRKHAAEGVVLDLLPVLDNLQLALQHADDSSSGLAQGVAMVSNQFREVLERNGVKAIQAVGEAFDPEVHDALMQRPSENVPEGHVIEEFQRGYFLGEKVLRPAKVVVSSGSAASGAAGESAEERNK